MVMQQLSTATTTPANKTNHYGRWERMADRCVANANSQARHPVIFKASLFLIPFLLLQAVTYGAEASLSPAMAGTVMRPKRALDHLEGDDFSLRRKRALDLMEGDGFGFEKRALDTLDGDDFGGMAKRSGGRNIIDNKQRRMQLPMEVMEQPMMMRQAALLLNQRPYLYYYNSGQRRRIKLYKRALDALEGNAFGF